MKRQNERGKGIERRIILRIDGSAGLSAGMVVWLLSDVLVGLYQIPTWLLAITISANLVYGIGASLLASWHQRPIGAVSALSVANLLWAVMCVITAVAIAPTASLFGVGHFVGEALFVGILGALEWRWRADLGRA